MAVGALRVGRAYPQEKLRALAETRVAARRALAQLEGCVVPRANGAFYFLLRVATERSAMAVAERLIREHRVAVIPGSAFGLTEGCHLRVAYAALPQDAVLEGFERLVVGLKQVLRGER